ncbi:MAG: hypothetical protein WBO19_07915 [Terriglobia bacterium]
MRGSMETNSKDKPGRVDGFGRAYAGSQRQIQTYVNLRPLELANKILVQLSPPPPPDSRIRWVSPLASENFAEYRDEGFLRVLRLDKFARDLQEFWPERGPSCDALGILESGQEGGVVLVEAKSHVSELNSECQAKDSESVKMIESALGETKRWLGIQESFNWRQPYYQTANRYAFLYFLRKRQISAWLVNVYFLNDPHFKNSRPPGVPEDWKAAIEDVERTLGLVERDVPYTVKLFLEASEGY